MFLMIIVLLFGTLLYLLEPCYDKTACAFTDVFDGAYFVLVTITTVGYGDMVAQSVAGRCLTFGIMVLGSLFLAMPITIIGGEFNRAWTHHAQSLNTRQYNVNKTKRLSNISMKYNGMFFVWTTKIELVQP